ncbi:MAG TPA: GNAT family N-acetyltransferase [Chloroflexi bacterium]|nr:GNAT family N-acetyltransferase [Chloroflexota bacterium]
MPGLPPQLVLRPTRSTDTSAIRTLVRNAHLDPTQLHWRQFWVIADEAEVIACGQLRHFPGVRKLGSLVVKPEWRRGGLATALVEHLLASTDAPVYLECRAGHMPFYERFGFKRVSWHQLPWPLKLKFGPMVLLSHLSWTQRSIMIYRGQTRVARDQHDSSTS